jgi:ketosteroid isomerase-like protein
VPVVTEDPTRAVIAMIEAYNARDIDALLDQFHPDAVWHTTPGFLWPGPYRGREALRGLFDHWWQGWNTGHAEPQKLVQTGDRAMLSAYIHGLSAGSGLDVEVTLNWVFHLRDGLIDVVHSYDTPAEAQAALVSE